MPPCQPSVSNYAAILEPDHIGLRYGRLAHRNIRGNGAVARRGGNLRGAAFHGGTPDARDRDSYGARSAAPASVADGPAAIAIMGSRRNDRGRGDSFGRGTDHRPAARGRERDGSSDIRRGGPALRSNRIPGKRV